MKSQTVLNTGNATAGIASSTRRRMVAMVAVVTFTSLTACSSPPNRSADAAPAAPAVVSMDEWMNRGDAAVKEGDHTRARDSWRAAAKDYPTAKQPWLRLSEDYFNAADYGNAVLAAQEALQRDPRDRMANSVLAVSGLRLTAGSLAALREDGTYPVGSRSEAVLVTRSLREALGEPVLVPAPESANKAKRVAARPAGRPPGATATGAAASPVSALPATLAAAPAPLPAPVPAATSGNPLNKLK